VSLVKILEPVESYRAMLTILLNHITQSGRDHRYNIVLGTC